VQVQPLGQSALPVQVVAFGLHHPGYEGAAVHSGAPPSIAGAGAAEPPLELAPVPLGPEELPLLTLPVPHPTAPFGWQTNPSPQSVSVLQGSCHLNAQTLRVVVVQVSVVRVGGPASQIVLAAQARVVPPPPEQVVDVCAKQTMPAPQSASSVQDFGSQAL
jgi:hypothetical protein